MESVINAELVSLSAQFFITTKRGVAGKVLIFARLLSMISPSSVCERC